MTSSRSAIPAVFILLLFAHQATADKFGAGAMGNAIRNGAKTESMPVVDPDQLPNNQKVVEPFKKHFDKCTARANMGTDCKFENLGIIGDEAHQCRPSCHNVGEAIDVGFIECAGQKMDANSSQYIDFVKCFADETGGEMNDIFHQTGGSPNVIQKSDHVKHVHIQLKNCPMVQIKQQCPAKKESQIATESEFLKQLSSFIAALVVPPAAAVPTEVKDSEIMKSFDKKLDAAGVGRLRLKYRYIGEPIARPADFTVYVQCQGMPKEVQVGSVDMCSLNSYEYVSHEKTVKVDAKTSRVDGSGKVFCDQREEKEFNLGDFCCDYARKKSRR